MVLKVMKKKYHEALYDYIKTGGEGLTLSANGRIFRFRLPVYEDVIRSTDYALYEVEKNSFLLATCLQSVGGFKVRSDFTYDLVKHFESTPKITQRVSGYLWRSVKDSHEYAQYFEAFCYTNRSRVLWQEWKQSAKYGFKLNAQDFPLTDLQQNWVAYNEAEDQKNTIEEDWSRAFFIGSSMNPKGVEKIQKDWKSKKEKEQDFRQRVVEEANKGEGMTEDKKESLTSEKSVDELRKEYWDWVEGREDDHDMRVRDYKEQVQRHINQRREMLQRQAQQAREMTESLSALNSLSMSSPIRAYTDEEVAKMTQGRERNTVNFDVDIEYAEHLSSRYLKSRKVPGGKIPSLQEQVQNRPTPKIER